jgi:hypothetical protein
MSSLIPLPPLTRSIFLHALVAQGDEEMIAALIESGADPRRLLEAEHGVDPVLAPYGPFPKNYIFSKKKKKKKKLVCANVLTCGATQSRRIRGLLESSEGEVRRPAKRKLREVEAGKQKSGARPLGKRLSQSALGQRHHRKRKKPSHDSD